MQSKLFRLLATAAVIAGAVAFAEVPPALAVDEATTMLGTGLVELDGNPQDNDPGLPDCMLPDDWENLFDEFGAFDTLGNPNPAGDGVLCASAGAFTGIQQDPFNGLPNVTSFATGGSKDPNFIADWKWKNASVQNKDNITNAFAAAYLNEDEICVLDDGDLIEVGTLVIAGTTAPCDESGGTVVTIHNAGDLIIYFGMDIFDNEGDKTSAFWFFQDQVGPIGVPSGPGAPFEGEHEIGDVIVIIDFPPAFWLSLWTPEGVAEDRGGHGIRPELLVRELEAAGFERTETIEKWPSSNFVTKTYAVAFQRP